LSLTCSLTQRYSREIQGMCLTVLPADSSFDKLDPGPSLNGPQQSNKIDAPSTSKLNPEIMNTRTSTHRIPVTSTAVSALSASSQETSKKQADDRSCPQTYQNASIGNFNATSSSPGIANTTHVQSPAPGIVASSVIAPSASCVSPSASAPVSYLSSPPSYLGACAPLTQLQFNVPPPYASVSVPLHHSSVLPPRATVPSHRVAEPPLQISR
jgi:hypothetical protein